MWGVHNENEAISKFEEVTGCTCVHTGLWLDESGVLGASPDGLVGDDCVLEVKCPYTVRNMSITDAMLRPDFCLRYGEEKQILLKKPHIYWHQVQGQLFLTKRSKCYFVVWTTKDCAVVEIARDSSWAPNLKRLRDFYFENLLPKIYSGELL